MRHFAVVSKLSPSDRAVVNTWWRGMPAVYLLLALIGAGLAYVTSSPDRIQTAMAPTAKSATLMSGRFVPFDYDLGGAQP
jgi:hypothetical protein